MDTSSPTLGQPDSPTGRYVILYPPDNMTAIERRVADVIRYGLYLHEHSPPGIYLVAEEGGAPRIVVKGTKNARTGDAESESEMVVESFSSGASESTVEGPASPTVTSQVKAMKPSELTSRAEDDPPEIVGSYVGLTYTDKAIAAMDYVKDKEALYCLQITIDLNGHKVAFNVQADTGANNAWLFHRHVCQLKDIKDDWDVKDGVACWVTLIAGTKRSRHHAALPPSHMPSYLAKHIETGICSGTEIPIHAHFHYPRIEYDSGRTKLVVGPMRSAIEFEIQNTHNWLTSGPDEKENLKARFSFAICDAATTSVFEDLRIDGLIGFGPEFNMTAFAPNYRHEQDYGNREYPSFSTALQARLPRVAGEGGIILYFYLNPLEVDEGYSFLAFNEFPAHLLRRSILWTAPIYVPQPLRSRQSRWVITIKRFVIHLIAGEGYKDRGGYEDKDLVIDFGEEGEEFHVDTGASTSTVPARGIEILQRAFDRSRPYSVPEWVDLRESKVEYTFASRESELVFVTQARWFLCDKHRQGLIWECPRPQVQGESKKTRCVLGLNFFHSAVVAMHRPRPGAGSPYFRLGAMVRRVDPRP